MAHPGPRPPLPMRGMRIRRTQSGSPSSRSSGRKPVTDAVLEWAITHPYDPAGATERAAEAEATQRAWLDGTATGAYCVNRTAFEFLRDLEPSCTPGGVNGEIAVVCRSRLVRTLTAWNRARWLQDAGRRSSPVFRLPRGGVDFHA
jgi:hypothetical protein